MTAMMQNDFASRRASEPAAPASRDPVVGRVLGPKRSRRSSVDAALAWAVLAWEICWQAGASASRPDTKPRTMPTKVATGVEPNQRSSPNPMKAGSENPRAMVVTPRPTRRPPPERIATQAAEPRTTPASPRRRGHREPRSLEAHGPGDQKSPDSLARSQNFEAEGGQSAISYTGHDSHVNHSDPNSRNFSQSRVAAVRTGVRPN